MDLSYQTSKNGEFEYLQGLVHLHENQIRFGCRVQIIPHRLSGAHAHKSHLSNRQCAPYRKVIDIYLAITLMGVCSVDCQSVIGGN